MSKVLQDRLEQKQKSKRFEPFSGTLQDRPPRPVFKKSSANTETNALIDELMAAKKALREAEEKIAKLEAKE